MKHLLDIYPHDVRIGLPDGETSYQSTAYADHMSDALMWLNTMGMKTTEHWRIANASGAEGVTIEFKRANDALLFKIAFG